MRILFDNNSLAYLMQQPRRAWFLAQLKELVDCGKVEVIGSFTLLEELTGLAKSHSAVYLTTLFQYQQLTKHKIVRPWNELLKMEVELHRPMSLRNSILDMDRAKKLFNRLSNPCEATSAFDLIYAQRKSYKRMMDASFSRTISDLANAHRREIMNYGRDWFENFDNIAQDWFVDLFNVRGTVRYIQLPHVAAFLSYTLTRIYERFSSCLPDRDTDLHDRAHFTDAVVADTLVTNDQAFIRTCLRVPHKPFRVTKLDDLILQLDT